MTAAIATQDNPYIIGRPIREPECFFGREDLFRFIKDNLNQNSQVILLYGQRRIGKTSILFHIPNFVRLEKFVFIPLSLQGKSHESLSNILQELAGDIKDYLLEELELPESLITLPSKEEWRKIGSEPKVRRSWALELPSLEYLQP